MNSRGMPSKIAYLVSRYPAVSHTFILREIRELRKNGMEIFTFSINGPDHPLEKLTREEQEEARRTYFVKRQALYDLLPAHLGTLLTRPWRYLCGLFFALSLGGLDLRKKIYGIFYFSEAVMIGWRMKKECFSDLHVHFANPAATVAMIISRVFPVAFSMTVHGPTEFEDTDKSYLRQKIKGAAFLCCISEFAKKQLMKASEPSEWGKMKVLPLGIETEKFRPSTSLAKQAPFEILCVGRLVPDKGQRVLIAAIDRLVRAKENIVLRLVGDGPDRTELEREVIKRSLEKSVLFEGNVNQDQILDYYRKAGVFVLASFAEGVPVVLMEAMAMEIPCVSTVVAGIPELIENGKSGALVPSGDEQALANAIMQFLKDPDFRKKIGAEGRRRVIEKYNLEQNMREKAAYFFEQLLKKKNEKEKTVLCDTADKPKQILTAVL